MWGGGGNKSRYIKLGIKSCCWTTSAVYRCNSNRSAYMTNAAAPDTNAEDRAGPVAALQLSSSQKHMCPVPVPSIMHTWSTMNRLICSCDVHVLLMLSYAVRGNHETCEYDNRNEKIILTNKYYYYYYKRKRVKYMYPGSYGGRI